MSQLVYDSPDLLSLDHLDVLLMGCVQEWCEVVADNFNTDILIKSVYRVVRALVEHLIQVVSLVGT